MSDLPRWVSLPLPAVPALRVDASLRQPLLWLKLTASDARAAARALLDQCPLHASEQPTIDDPPSPAPTDPLRLIACHVPSYGLRERFMAARAQSGWLLADCAPRLRVAVSVLRSIESGAASATPELAARMEQLIVDFRRPCRV